VTGSQPLERIPYKFSLKFAISEKAVANSHGSFLQMKEWVDVERSVILGSNFVLWDK
jgi:hypothetical protein